MKPPAWRGLPLLVLLLLPPFFTLARQELFTEDVAISGAAHGSQQQPPRHIPKGRPLEGQVTPEGSTLVHEIWSSLRESYMSTEDGHRSGHQSGALDIVWYYSKAVFRLLFMNAPKLDQDGDEFGASRMSKDLANKASTLEMLASYNDPDAIFLVAEMNFYGNFTHPRNFRTAFDRYNQLALLNGNSTAQYMLGLLYATGIGGAVATDQAKALLYHTFAAEQGNTRSEMTVAFRHHAGIATAKDCDKGAYYYEKVARKAIAYWRSGPPGGHNMPKLSYKWAEDTGGIYGEGASFSSSGFNANKGEISHSHLDYVLEYLDTRERDGDMHATYSLGKYYYEGNRGYRRNLKKARHQFMKVARAYWGKDGKINQNGPKNIDKIAGKAAAHIGRMFLRGEGVEESFEKAATWFRRGIANGEALCQYHMGLMYRDGLGVAKDAVRATTFFKAAAEQDLPAASATLGALFLDQGDVETATRYFELSARHGYTEAFYYLAEMTNKGIGRHRHCGMATAYYKIVAEKVEVLHSSFNQANAAYEDNDLETALLYSTMAAEQGYESAQANVAYILDAQTSFLSTISAPLLRKVERSSSPRSMLHNAALSLIYWTRSAKQHNIDSLVKMGDYYLSGIGTVADLDKASVCYQAAAEEHHSAQALWNLGWMHENGVGPVSQDFHMAKRYYDLALEMNTEAYLPVKLALVRLRTRSWWNGVTGGKINGIQPEENEEGLKRRSLSEWVAHFLDAADEMAEQEPGGLDDLELDGMHFDTDPMPGGDDNYDDFDDGLVESLIIIGLAATLAFLVYYRQQRQLQNRRNAVVAAAANANVGVDALRDAAAVGHAPLPPPAAAEAGEGAAAPPLPAAEADGGFFPNPGDPDWNQWVAGGVGH